MDDSELVYLLHDMESDRVERKASSNDPDRLCEAICAFANDLPNHRQPGVLFIGVHDNGRCANLTVNDDLLLKLADLRSNGNILPFPSMTVQKKTLDGCDLAVVVVEPSDDPPVRFRGRTWIRVGPRRAIATPEEERRLTEKRRSRNVPFDIQPVMSASLDDLDLEYFKQSYLPVALAKDILAENQRTITEQLSSLRFATLVPYVKPTTLGMLVAGKDPARFFPGAYVQFLRLEGAELTDPIIDRQEMGGQLSEVIRKLNEKLQAHISTAVLFNNLGSAL